jgi:micrococcal nuclease
MSSHVDPKVLQNRRLYLIVAIAIIIVASFFNFNASDPVSFGLPDKTPNTVGIYYKVTKVTDGDTLHVMIEGRDEIVRLIGINTPETVHPEKPVECFGKEASQRLKELAKGGVVRLEYDDSQSLRDTYDRLLAYVYLEDGQMLNRKMIAEGYAYEYTYMTPYKYQKEFRELQYVAQSAKRGLWAENTCNGSKQFSQ